MKFGQDCAIVRERVGLCKPDRLGDHVVQEGQAAEAGSRILPYSGL
jgi:hypothetical protein